MSQDKTAIKQLDDESMQDYIKFLVFAETGTNRNLNQVFQKYYETTNQVSQTWQALAQQYRWEERASEYDKVKRPDKHR